MNEEQMKKELKMLLCSEKYKHSLGVGQAAIKLSEIFGYNPQKAYIAGLLHDCAKNFTEDKALKLCNDFCIVVDDITKIEVRLLHAPLGAEIARQEFGIDDEDILDAIRYHTVRRVKMTLLTKIIYLADYIELERRFAGVEKLRELAYETKDLDKAILFGIERTIKRVLDKGRLLHPDTIAARNYILLSQIKDAGVSAFTKVF